MEPKSTGSSQLDIKALIAKSDVEVKFQRKESRAELTARLAREDADAAHQRAKEFFLLRFVAAVTIVCLIAPLLPFVPEDTRKAFSSILAVIVAAAVSFMVGKSGK